MCNTSTLFSFWCFNCAFVLVPAQNFFKHHYETVFERATIENVNRSVALASASILMYNRTARPLTMQVQVLRDLQDDSVVLFKAYQLKSNEYRLTALQFAMNIRKALQIDVGGFDDLLKSAVPPIKWPLQKRVTYSIKKWLPNNNKMPFPYAPVGKWKDIITFYTDNKITRAFEFVLYYRIEDIPDV